MERGLDVIAGMVLIVAAAALLGVGLASGSYILPVGADELIATSDDRPTVFAGILAACLAAMGFGGALAAGRLGASLGGR